MISQTAMTTKSSSAMQSLASYIQEITDLYKLCKAIIHIMQNLILFVHAQLANIHTAGTVHINCIIIHVLYALPNPW